VTGEPQVAFCHGALQLEVVETMKGLAQMAAIFATLAVATAAHPLKQAPHPPKQKLKLEPPKLTTASPIPYPPDSVAAGMVTLCVSLDAGGKISDLQPLRDIPALTSPALNAVKNWTFTPAKLNAQALGSTISVNVVFVPSNLDAGGLSLVPRSNNCQCEEPEPFVAPEVLAASYPEYPANSVAEGTVVLNLTVDKKGHLDHVVAIQPEPSLTEACIAAVNKWSFQLAALKGFPVGSNMIVAFVFRRITM
jgi:outer membrane biosynthesis protein TonB